MLIACRPAFPQLLFCKVCVQDTRLTYIAWASSLAANESLGHQGAELPSVSQARRQIMSSIMHQLPRPTKLFLFAR